MCDKLDKYSFYWSRNSSSLNATLNGLEYIKNIVKVMETYLSADALKFWDWQWIFKRWQVTTSASIILIFNNWEDSLNRQKKNQPHRVKTSKTNKAEEKQRQMENNRTRKSAKMNKIEAELAEEGIWYPFRVHADKDWYFQVFHSSLQYVFPGYSRSVGRSRSWKLRDKG